MEKILTIIKKYTKSLFALLIYWMVYHPAYGQSHRNIGKLFSDYHQKNLVEKIFLHLDKGFYLTGEILWFKAYCVDGTYNKPLDLSKVGYVELLNDQQESVLQAKIDLQKGSGTGSLYLPGTLKTGVYQVRAYTNWMKNYGAEGYFVKTIKVVNTLKEEGIATKEEVFKNEYRIEFYPEGGNLVRGLESKVAFQIQNSHGKGIDAEVTILNHLNQKVTSAKSRKFGIGSFVFKPETQGSYRAQVALPSGAVLNKELPKIFDSGYVLGLEDLNTSEIKVSVTGADTGEGLQLLVHQGQRLIEYKDINLVNGKAELRLKKQDLPEGISRFTLFDGLTSPRCERLYFQKPKRVVNLNLSTDKAAYASRTKVSLELDLTDATGGVSRSDMSIAVFRIDSLDEGDPNSIVSYLLFTSELRGTIESPEYYINGDDPESVDNLLLTHGWRRFRWEDILNKRIVRPRYLPEYLGHIVTGKITHIITEKPIGGISSYLSVPGKIPKLFIAESDSSGKLFFHTRNVDGPGEILLQNNYAIDSTYRIDIVSPFSPDYATMTLPSLTVNEKLIDQLNVRSVNVQTTNIFKGNNFNQYRPKFRDSISFYGLPTKKYKLDDYVRFTAMNEVITEYIAEVRVQKINKVNKMSVFDAERHEWFTGDPLVLLDGLPVFNDQKILEFDPLKVKTIETVSTKYSIGAGYFDGIVNFLTYTGDMQGFEVDPKATVMNYEGVQFQREFYSPQYVFQSEISSTVPDFRDLLSWVPNVTVGRTGKTVVEFYTSDQAGQYQVFVNGLTEEGKPFSKSTNFTVVPKSL